jgi:hypothetical protein
LAAADRTFSGVLQPLKTREGDAMGKARKYNKKPKTRPKKSTGDKRRREKVQSKRLIALGATEESVKRMNPKRVRDFLKRPNRVRKASAK